MTSRAIKIETTGAPATSSPTARTLRGTARAQPTKKQQLIRLLSAKAGADVTTIGRKLGWQPHTVRAALSGLRKAGYTIDGERPGAGRAVRYRILAAAPAAGAAGGNAAGDA